MITLHISDSKKAWYVVSDYEDKDTVKAAGFWWHPNCNGRDYRGKPCKACKANVPGKSWWTPDKFKAARLAEYSADDSVFDSLADHVKSVEDSRAVDASIDIPAPDGLEYLPYQKAGIAYAVAKGSCLIGDEMGLGKGHPVDTMVLTPFGWKEIGSLSVGDQVIGSQGTPVNVTGVYQRGVLPVNIVVFNDGSRVVVDDDHLWAARTNNDQYRNKPFRTKTTKELASDLDDAAGNYKWRIPIVKPVQLPTQQQLIDPYLMGVLLGDGHLSCEPSAYTPGDWDVPREIAKVLPSGCSQHPKTNGTTTHQIVSDESRTARNPVLDAMRSYGLSGMASDERFVPDCYLMGSEEQRLHLLQGLMDTDGEARQDGTLEFSSSSYLLTEAVVWLAQSLGGIARRSFKAEPKYTYKGEKLIGRPSFIARLSMPPNINPLRAHADRYVCRTKYLPNRVFRSITPCGESEVICISVDAEDQLYVTEECIVTHNTIQALGVVNACEDIKSVLVVCPASLRLNWAREAQKWLVRDMSVGIMNTNDMPPTDVVVTNYDRLIKKPALDALMSRNWDLLVVDECHYAKNPEAKRTVALLGRQGKPRKKIAAKKGLVDQSKRMLLLTGTPLLNRPKELWSLLWGMDHKEWKSFWAFAKRYCDAHDNGWGWDVSGSSNTGELQERLRGTCMIRRLKKDVLTELPAKRRQIVPIPPNGASKFLKSEQSKSKAFDLMADVEVARACDDEQAYEAAVAKLDAAVAAEFAEMAALRKKMGVAKVPHAIEAIESAIESSEKVVAWAHHHDVIDALMDKFGDQADRLDGRMDMADRQKSVDRFQNDESVKLFVGQIQAAGVGLTLTASSHEIFVEQDWTPGMMQQAEDRCHRIGQTESVLIQILVFDGSLDSYMAKMLVSKQKVADAVLDVQAALPGPSKSKAKAKTQKRTYPVPTDEVREAAGQALMAIAGMCDGASTEDGCGFSKVDVAIGHSLAQRAAGRPLTDGETWLACKLARKYRRQLGESITEVLKLYESKKVSK